MNTAVSVENVVFETDDYVIADQDEIYKFNQLNDKTFIELAIEKEKLKRLENNAVHYEKK